jgi:hypothetical protein
MFKVAIPVLGGITEYLAVTSQLDMYYTANVVSQFNKNYSEEYWRAAKTV